MKSFLRNSVINALGFFLIPQLFSGLHIFGTWWTIATAAIVFALISLIIRPILKIITLPLTIITFGLFSFFINAILLYLLTIFVPQVSVTAFTFPGATFYGFVIPSIYFNLLFCVYYNLVKLFCICYSYRMDISIKNKKIVCLGGGIGTVNLIKGLTQHVDSVSVVVSMADEGGSSGRLRRMYNIFPPGDLVSCIAAVASHSNPLLSDLLTYRFPGDRYGEDQHLAGHKLGNLIMVALRDTTGDFHKAIAAFQELFKVKGTFLPATNEPVSISAQTIEGQQVHGEESIDLGKYTGKRVLEKVFIHPEDPQVSEEVISLIKEADVIIAGPGDLYTTILPVLIIPKIAEAVKQSNANKFFVVNVANKPFETKGYSVQDFLKAVEKHVGSLPFNKIVINNDVHLKIPSKYHYDYVKKSQDPMPEGVEIIEDNLVEEEFPLYHSPEKLAKVILENI